jgi:hypothetical protein
MQNQILVARDKSSDEILIRDFLAAGITSSLHARPNSPSHRQP